jgi:hypothetical protein
VNNKICLLGCDKMYESTIELNDFQKEIWLNNYKAPSDNTIEDTFRRVANTIAAVEEDQ